MSFSGVIAILAFLTFIVFGMMFVFFERQSMRNIAVIVLSFLVFVFSFMVHHEQCRAEYFRSPEFSVQFKANAPILDEFLSGKPTAKSAMFWKGFETEAMDFVADEMWPYHEILVKHLGGNPTEQEFLLYWRDVARPALFENVDVTYHVNAQNLATAGAEAK